MSGQRADDDTDNGTILDTFCSSFLTPNSRDLKMRHNFDTFVSTNEIRGLIRTDQSQTRKVTT